MEPNFGGNLARTFNTAKKYAEEILFPKMDLFQKYQRQADFGDENLDNAIFIDSEIRDIQRFNGLKAMNNILYGLLLNISSTIKVNNKKGELKLLKSMITLSKKISIIFDENKERFFKNSFYKGQLSEQLDKSYFLKVKDVIEKMYINCEILMTKNKLLFAETRDEFVDDKTIIKNIKEEYIEG